MPRFAGRSFQIALLTLSMMMGLWLYGESAKAQNNLVCRKAHTRVSVSNWQPNLRSLQDVPEIEWRDIQRPYVRPPHEISGNMHLQILEGWLESEKIFVKVSHLRSGDLVFSPEYQLFLNEVAWTQHLHEIGLGPAFHGIAVTPQGHLAIVTEFIDGQSANLPRILSVRSPFRLQPSVFEDLRRIRQWIEREGIAAHDLEVRWSSHRAYVVDPAYFQTKAPQDKINASLKAIDDLILKLKRNR